MKKHSALVFSIAVLLMTSTTESIAQMRSKSQGGGAPVVTAGSSPAPNLSGATQAPLNFDISGLSFSGANAISLPNASGGSGSGQITYASTTPTICSVSGNLVTPVSPGSCTITATKAASGVYGTVSASSTKIITPISQPALIFSISNLDLTSGAATFPVATGGAGGGAITYTSNSPTICTVSGTTVTRVSPGTCLITATKAGSDAMGPVSAQAQFVIAPVTQAALVFPASLSFNVNAATLPGVTGGSGNGAITYTASGACSLSGTTLTTNSTGTCTVTATKAAEGIYGQLIQTKNYSVTYASPLNVAIGSVEWSTNPAYAIYADMCRVTLTVTGGVPPYTRTKTNNPVNSIVLGNGWYPAFSDAYNANPLLSDYSNPLNCSSCKIYAGRYSPNAGTFSISDSVGQTKNYSIGMSCAVTQL
jgi:hypothetical protein